ncbi:hypothetical protein M3Y98_01006500 [Aphelenchoides besseyi]|nr:hypothetical protein M3Y98_01006500 [Aphelenchoides besseyi]
MNCALKKLVEASVSLEDRFEDSRYNVEWMLGTLLDCHREFRESITRSNVAKVDVMKIGEQTGFCSHLLKVTITFVDSTENPISFVLKIPNADRICERMVDSWNMQETYVQCSIPKNKWNGRFAKNIHVSTESEGGEYKADSLRRAMSLRNCELEKQLKRILSIDWYRFSKFAIIDKAKEYNANTLSHGDTWCNNLMFRLNSNGSIGNTIEGIVDWQTMFEGSALFDLARFLVLSADPDIRRAIQHKMVDFFYAELTKNFAVHDLTPPFTLDQAQELFLLAAFHQTPMLVLYYALIYEPMERSELEADRLRAESAWLKVRLAFEDAEPVWEKYRILEIFGKRTN